MTSPSTDRRLGLIGNTAYKAPVTVVAATNITLSGEQTIDGIAVLASNSAGARDRVLCVGQTDTTQNGIWDVSTSAWSRSLDANGNYDLAQGTTVGVNRGNTYAGSYWRLTTSGAITIGTTSMTWARALTSDISTLSFLQAGSGALARGAQDKMRDAICILDFIPESEHAGIVAGTSTYNCYTAIVNAIASVTASHLGIALLSGGPEIYFPPGNYVCNSTLHLKKRVHLRGAGAGMAGGWQASVTWPASTAGIVVHKENTDSTGTVAATTGADGTIIEGLVIRGALGSGASSHGIWLRARAVITDCEVSNFAANNINVVASAGGGGFVEGNANCFVINNVRLTTAGGHGLFVDGADANAGTITHVDASQNTGWGIYDSSFLGNTYVGCHTEGNTLGGYKSDGVNARTLFVGCYSEQGQPANEMAHPTVVVGGVYGAGITGTFVDMRVEPTMTAGQATSSTLQTITHSVGAVNPSDGNVEQLLSSDEPSTPFRLKYQTGRWFWNWANNGFQFMKFYNTQATVANGYARTLTNGQVGFEEFYLGSITQMKRHSVAAAAPVSGTHIVGDIVWDNAPTAGGTIGWVCTTAGTPGTWKTFGDIAP